MRRYTALLLVLSAWAGGSIAVEPGDRPQHPAVDEARGISSRRVTSVRSSDGALARPETRVTRGHARSRDQGASSAVDLQRIARRALGGASLALVASLLLLILLKRSRHSAVGGAASDSLKLISTITIAPRCCVSLIQARDHTILVARDASGLKEMMVLPEAFASYLDGPKLATSTMASDSQQR